MALSRTDMEKEIYEGREKMRRDERAWRLDFIAEQTQLMEEQKRQWEEQRGQWEEQKLQQGELIGRVVTLQQLLGQTPTPREELRALDADELSRLADSLQQRLSQ